MPEPVDYLNDFGTPSCKMKEYNLLKVCNAQHKIGCDLYRSKPELISRMLDSGLGTPIAWRWKITEHSSASDVLEVYHPGSLGLTFYIENKNSKPHQGAKEKARRIKQSQKAAA